jgi:hypothetical protein
MNVHSKIQQLQLHSKKNGFNKILFGKIKFPIFLRTNQILDMKLSLLLSVVSVLFLVNAQQECWNWNGEMGCSGNQVDPNPNFSNRTFQTPPRGSTLIFNLFKKVILFGKKNFKT